MRLLIVHDDDDFLDMASRWFGRRGFMVMACETASEAVSAVERVAIDAAVVGEGFDRPEFQGLIRQLRMLEPSLSIVALSGWLKEGEVAAPMSEGSVECVAISTDLIALEAAVRRALNKEFQVCGALVMREQHDAS